MSQSAVGLAVGFVVGFAVALDVGLVVGTEVGNFVGAEVVFPGSDAEGQISSFSHFFGKNLPQHSSWVSKRKVPLLSGLFHESG